MELLHGNRGCEQRVLSAGHRERVRVVHWLWLWLWLLLLLNGVAATALAREGTALQVRIAEGDVLNVLHQDGPAAAHLLLSSGKRPRVLVAFPAGNSGVGLWFENVSSPVRWTLTDARSRSRRDDKGRMLHGIIARAEVEGRLVVRDAVLSSVRVLRDYQSNGSYPESVRAKAKINDDRNGVEWSRPRLDGTAGYVLSIQLENGEVRGGDGEPITFVAARDGEALHMSITALTGETPLRPLARNQLINARARDDARSRDVLQFLAYQEKYLAGSWRFNTYFGRDTLMSMALLMPALQPQAIENGLASVLERLAPNGEVAHEEDIGEFAILRHLQESGRAQATPIYDYKMVDDDFMLAPVAAAYLLDHEQGRKQARAFLARRNANGERMGTLLVRNFAWVMGAALPFANAPEPVNLISLKSGTSVGQWRDSENGLAGGRYPYDINVALVPAALTAIARLVDSGLLKPYMNEAQRKVFAGAGESAAVWTQHAPPMFRVALDRERARRGITDYAVSLEIKADAAIESLPDDELTLAALALDEQQRPIPIVHSDGGFTLLLREPPVEELDLLVRTMLRPFPAGLLTEAGLLVANPAFVGPETQRAFSRNAYHGTVTWSWHQALLAAGLARQLQRGDLPAPTRQLLQDAQARLWAVIERARELRTSELWSWRYVNGRFEPAPFGQSAGDVDESNAAQLWSTVYLAIHPPMKATSGSFGFSAAEGF